MSDAEERRRAGFKDRTRLADARRRLREVVPPHDRIEAVAVADADGRVLAEAVESPRDVPGYRRAAMDGYAVRARDTFGAGDRSPAVLRRVDHEAVAGDAEGTGDARSFPPRGAVRVHTGSEVPAGADAVVPVEAVETVGDELEAFDAVAEGENVGAPDEDVAAGQRLFAAGHRLRPSGLGLLKAVGVREVTAYEPPAVAVIPTGEELVDADPEPGEVVETNGRIVSRLVERWGGRTRVRDPVADDEAALREAVRADVDADVVVTTGGSSVGERDLVPDVVADLGEVAVHGVALKPGAPAGFGRVDGTPVVMLPGSPVAAVVAAVQLLRPATKRAGRLPLDDPPSVGAELARKLHSEVGVRSFARVKVEGGDGDDGDGDGREADDRPVADPVRTSGAGVLSSVALADGWVVVPEASEGLAAGSVVDVEFWEWSP